MATVDLASLAAEENFIEGLGGQLARDISVLLDRQHSKLRCDSVSATGAEIWFKARFNLSHGQEVVDKIRLYLSKADAVRLGADLVKAPNAAALIKLDAMPEMVQDGMHELANVVAPALARALKPLLGQAWSCRLADVATGPLRVPEDPTRWSLRAEFLLRGFPEPFLFYFQLPKTLG